MQRRAPRRVALPLAGAFLALAAAALAAAWLRLRFEDPLSALPRERPGDEVVERESRLERWRGRTLLHVTLGGSAVGLVRLVASLPDPPGDRPLPVLVVLGGLRGGSNAIRQVSEVVGEAGPNAIIGYDWPMPPREPGILEAVLRAPALRRDILSVPGQVDAIIRWASSQPWADRERVSLLGFSLGGFVTPAAQRLVQERGSSVRWTVVAYAGAPIADVIAGHPAVKPRWLAGAQGAVAGLLLRPVEPSLHLPHLRGRFLVLGGRTDRLIAPAAAERMRELTPQPRTVILLEGEHMGKGASREVLLRQVIETTRSWLLEEGAIEPPGSEGSPPAPPRR